MRARPANHAIDAVGLRADTPSSSTRQRLARAQDGGHQRGGSTGGVAHPKFAVPHGPGPTLARARLLEALDAGVTGPLTLIAAPAGAGKSALVSSWIASGRPPGPVAWVSLDADDRDRPRFWRAVLDSLAEATGEGRVADIRVKPREPMSVSTVLTALGDALAERTEPVVLVLDDLHLVSEVAGEDLERMVRFPPPALRTVVMTRVDPPIGLVRLRLDGALSEIRARDLAFSLGETRALFAALGLELGDHQLAMLWRRTEGWAAGLRLAAMSLRGHDAPAEFIEHFAGTDATVSDYLLTEILGRERPDVRDFLLRTSIVEVVSADLADALTGGSGAYETLAHLEHGGALMAPLDDHGTWHRYHPLFAELLRAELRARLPGEVAQLHRRAALWMAEHGDTAAALRHAADSDSWDLVIELVVERWMRLLVSGEVVSICPLLERIPADRVQRQPELALAFAAALLARADEPGASRYLEQADRVAGLVAHERRARFEVGAATLRLSAARLRGDLDASREAARELLARRTTLDDLSGRFRDYVLTELGLAELWAGRPGDAIEHLELAYASSIDGGCEWLACLAAAHLAVARSLCGQVSRAVRRAADAVDLAERRGWTRTLAAAAAYNVQGAISLQRGEREVAVRAIEQAWDALETGRDAPLNAVLAVNRVFLLSDDGRYDLALSVLQAARDDLGARTLPETLEAILVAQEGLLRTAVGDRRRGQEILDRAAGTTAAWLPVANARAHLQLLDGEPAAARAILARHLADPDGAANVDGPVALRAEAWVLDALACDALADHDDAARSLERALELAEPSGFLRPIVAHGRLMRPLLRRHVRRGTAHPAMVHEALGAIERPSTGRSHRPAQPLAVSLSEREEAILRYLPTMMSNQDIAGELFVSVNTVKTHLKAIYRKLDATDRRGAVERARRLALLP